MPSHKVLFDENPLSAIPRVPFSRKFRISLSVLLFHLSNLPCSVHQSEPVYSDFWKIKRITDNYAFKWIFIYFFKEKYSCETIFVTESSFIALAPYVRHLSCTLQTPSFKYNFLFLFCYGKVMNVNPRPLSIVKAFSLKTYFLNDDIIK